jgi:hypothetical protein
LLKLRTEIVLKDANDVAFWFSLSFDFATSRQQRTGKRILPATHQTRARPKALFPNGRSMMSRMNSGEGEPLFFLESLKRVSDNGVLDSAISADTEERDD